MTATLFLTGLLGLLIAPTTGVLAWTVMLGFAQGGRHQPGHGDGRSSVEQ
jgi:hypothetical protein